MTIHYDRSRFANSNLWLVLAIRSFFSPTGVFGLCLDFCGVTTYIKLSHGVCVGDFLINSNILANCVKATVGFRAIMSTIFVGGFISELQSFNSINGLIKAPGTYGIVVANHGIMGCGVVQLPSGAYLVVSLFLTVTLGRNSLINNRFLIGGGARKNLQRGYKPVVRGVAMNPVDHPHGGRTKTNKPEVSPWGWVAKFNK